MTYTVETGIAQVFQKCECGRNAIMKKVFAYRVPKLHGI